MVATRVRRALAALACAFAGVALIVLLPWPDPLGENLALIWFLLAVGLELVATVLGNRSVKADPKGGAGRWLAVASLVLPLTVLFLALCFVVPILLYILAG